jgi:hypothetical protein
MQRDLSIDFVRGGGVLMIAVDHLGGLLSMAAGVPISFPFVTWGRLGWSSAAEFFVFFSGYLVGIIYTRTLRDHGLALTYARAANRAWQIYVANLLTLCAVLVLLYLLPFSNHRIEAATGLDALTGDHAIAELTAFLALQGAPAFFEILQLYVVLLLVAPVLLLVARMNILAPLACSVALWACVQWNPHFNIAGWNFNPFAWQLVFILGMLSSVGDVFAKLTEAFGRRKLLLVTGSLLLLALLVKIADKADWSLPLIGQFDMVGTNRTAVRPVMLLHFLVSVVFVMQIVPQGAMIARSWVARLVARVGQYSLECFCVSTALVYPAAAWMIRTELTRPMVIFVTGMQIIVFVCLWAIAVNWIKSQPWRGARSAAVAANISMSVPKTVPHVTAADTRSVAAPDIPREPA